jgi:peptide/nickel transport system permease protein
MALIPSVFAPYNPQQILSSPLLPPSHQYWLGTDEVGRDILSRAVYGARTDVVISLSAAVLAFIVGAWIGLTIGYFGGPVDVIGSRVVDVFLAFPAIVLALFLIAVFGHGIAIEIAAIAVVMIPSMARLARGEAIRLRHRAYVEASVLMRAPSHHILRRHLIPNALRTLLVAGSVLAASAVLIGASLSYLGLGPQPPTPSWGGSLNQAFQVVFQAPLYGVVPGVCITLLAFGYMLLARGLGELQRGDAGGTVAVTTR